MKTLLHIIQKPLLTERATQLKAMGNQYVFRVNPNANKQDIKQAVEAFFKVHVRNVRTMRMPGKFRRLGSTRGSYRPDWKKAIVTLQAGQEIKILEEKE